MLNRPLTPASASPTRHPAHGQNRPILVVGIGASAGGLEAATRLLDALPSTCRSMAFILVQHLDPAHPSMLVELLAHHTGMTVLEARDGMPVEPAHVYVIAPGTYLAVQRGAGEAGSLRVSAPNVRHGARMPVDFLLSSMAASYGDQAACIILSGTGADGSAGVVAISGQGGLCIAQDPADAGYTGMPRAAVATGKIEYVRTIRAIPAVLAATRAPAHATESAELNEIAADGLSSDLSEIVELLRTETAHDFTRYKSGTLQRRIERRMALADIRPSDMRGYFRMLQTDPSERDILASDLLINVTQFFRDETVFAHLAETLIPDLVRNHALDRPLRIWVAGCSTGEETYSLAMLFLEEISASKRPVKLQVFGSDADGHAVAAAREGVYGDIIKDTVTADRLARFFSREENGYRASAELRGVIVFTIQDVLADPPFSRLDFVSCRNLLIYLKPEAQAKVIARFHFALKPGAILLLGTAETIVEPDGMFELLSKPDRIYRRIGRNRTSSHDTGPQPDTDRFSDIVRRPPISVPARTRTRPASLAELGRRLVIDTYAPAAILIDSANEILFSLGPTDRYLRLAPGHSTHGLLAMARPGLRTKLRAALNTARENGAKTVVTAKIADGRRNLIFNLEILPVLEAGEDMLLVCFVEIPEIGLSAERDVAAGDVSRIAELERELEATRGELQETLRELEQSGEAQKATDEEALSVNEEHQSTNEELLTSKEELQSLNEELTALNAQLQETLERQRTTADDLQNVLYSTNVATLFLDMDLKIRFFTPATTSLFAVIAGDVGRPLSDLAALTPDGELEGDCRRVIQSQDAIERQIQSKDGIWFRRSILPYRVHGNRVEGVVITFTDVTARIHAAEALEAAKRQAETANAEKSRFLAAASHDLRQPLQTLALLASLLGKSIEGEKAVSLMARLDETVGAMTSMLDTLLDINEIEAGSVRAHPVPFPIGVMLRRIRDEFIYHAQAKELKLEVVDCSLVIESDPRLLEQMLRNLLSNAIKYTKRGRILMGCRRQHGALRIEILDTGIGIPEASLGSIFDEYTQIDNAARERSRGLGLGLAIVKRLSVLLGHRISVTSRLHKGSCFSVLVPLASSAEQSGMSSGHDGATDPANQTARILLVEDDSALRELLQLSLREEGHHVVSAPDGIAALATLPAAAPELLLVDFNLPNGMNGVELAARIRKIMGKAVPVIILTGNIAADAKRDAARLGYGMMRKPIKHGDLMKAIGHLIAATQLPAQAATNAAQASVTTDDVAAPIVYVVDDDANIRAAMIAILENSGRVTQGFATGEAFLQHYHGGTEACLLIDAVLPGMSGIDLIETLRASGQTLPAIMVTGQGDLTMAVRAMKAGATDFIEKPLAEAALLGCVERALEQSHDDSKRMAWHNDAANHVSGLTTRQREIMTLVLAGHPSKNIAADLGISQRTVENHRASIMRKTGAASVPALARLALAAEQG